MGHDDRREIYERLEQLERMLDVRRGDRGGEHRGHRGHDRHRHGHGGEHGHHDHDCCGEERGDFEEKRIIDTIVRLVTEHVAGLLREQQHDGGGEKRIVDLIVGLVSEHVKDIVATELDRRFGPAPAGQADRPAGTSEPDRT